jgi:nucleoside-diphosphate kinase
MLTLAIIKPDAVRACHAGKILAQLESAGFAVRAARLAKLTPAQAETFYEVHRERPFYRSLVTFMTSGPSLALALERADAVAQLRDVIGATDPAEAKPGTKELRVPGQGREDVVVAQSVLDAPGDRLEDLLDLAAPLLRRLGRDAGVVRHQPARGPMVRPPSTISVCPVM